MTIKNRLFISNILMIIIPMVLSVAVTNIASGIIRISLQTDNPRDYAEGDSLHYAIEQTRVMTGIWIEENKDLHRMQSDMDRFAEAYGQMSLALFKEGEPVYAVGGSYETELLDMALNARGRHTVSMDNLYVYTDDVNGYKLVLSDTKYQPESHPNFEVLRTNLSRTMTLASVIVIIIILGTNLVLTYTVFRSIMSPLNTLADGVRQIRDGNLSCKISYTHHDEFKPLCEDFNDMGERLQSMVNAVQRDDENRKLMIAGISHDLRTPLTSIKGYAIGLEQGMDLTPDVRNRYISTIRRKTDEIERMINQLFTFSKLDIGEFPFRMGKADIGRELEGFVDERTEEYRQKGLAVFLKESPCDAEVNIDSERFRDVLVNILENAVRYGRTGDKRLEIVCKEKDGQVCICLTDDGPGAPPEDLDKLFRLFYRGDKSRNNPSQGSGLGLAISAMIMKRMGGTITASNVAAEGGTVCGFCVILKLPAAAKSESV